LQKLAQSCSVIGIMIYCFHQSRCAVSVIVLSHATFCMIGRRKYSLFSLCTVKNIRIRMDILWRVFHILTEPVPYAFVSVNRRNNEARTHASGTGSVEIRKTRCEISVDLRIFFTVYYRLSATDDAGLAPAHSRRRRMSE